MIIVGPLFVAVPGEGYPGPLPKGSLRPVGSRAVRGGRVRMAEQVDGATSWLNHQANEIRKWGVSRAVAAVEELWPFPGPVRVSATFLFRRPASVTPGSYPVGREGDLDKLQRSLGDALTLAGAIKDDRLVVSWLAHKRYAADACTYGPGVRLLVDSMAMGDGE